MSIGCPVCLAADYSSDDLPSLVRWQAVKLDQARDRLLGAQLESVERGRQQDRLRARIRELEEIVERQNVRLQGRAMRRKKVP